MVFAYPAFLWALLAVFIPIIIHLFNFRRYTKIYFTNVRFLRELQTESKSKSRLKELLILACRVLAIAALVLAFAQPTLPNKNSTLKVGAKHIGIYLDNSFSMENISKQGPLLEIAKQKAKEIVKGFNSNDKFYILSNDFEGKHQRFYSKEDVLETISEIKASSASKQLSNCILRQTEFLNAAGAETKLSFVISDAQISTFDLQNIKNDSTIKSFLLPLQANKVNNVYIDTCWFETPIQQKGFIQKLHAVIKNNGGAAVDAGSAKLFINQQQLAISSFSMDANSKTEVLFSFECKTSENNFGSIKIEDYPITFDDELFFAFNSKLNVYVCLINGKNTNSSANPFVSLFSTDSLFNLKTVNEQAIDYKLFSSSNVIILNELSEISSGLQSELLKFQSSGGCILLVPSNKIDVESYNKTLQTLNLPQLGMQDSSKIKTEPIDMANNFYAGVFEKVNDKLNLPLVTNHYKLQKNNASVFETILQLQNSDVLLGLNSSKGKSYLLSASLNQNASNFAKHALFVPTIYKICFSSLKALPLFFYTGNNELIKITNNDSQLNESPPHIKQQKSNFDLIPEFKSFGNELFLYTRNQITNNGFYFVSYKNKTDVPLAFNFGRIESQLECYTVENLQKILEDRNLKSCSIIENATQTDLSKNILQNAEGKKLWKLFILLTLIFIAIETLLIRFLK